MPFFPPPGSIHVPKGGKLPPPPTVLIDGREFGCIWLSTLKYGYDVYVPCIPYKEDGKIKY